MRSYTPLLAFLAAVFGCATRSPAVRPDVFAFETARAILRPADEAERRAIESEVAFLAESYGYEPTGDTRELRALRDLVFRTELREGLHGPAALRFGRDLVDHARFRFRPSRGRTIVAAAEGPAAAALADPDVRAFLDRLAAEDRLHPEAGEDILRIRPRRVDALLRIARDPAGVDRVRGFDLDPAYRFRPSDAAALLGEAPVGPAEADFLRGVLRKLRVEARPVHLPEFRTLLAHRAETDALVRISREAEVRLAGPGAVMVLARLVGTGPLSGEEERRLRDLSGRAGWPDAGDFLFLVPLARAPGSVEVVDRLAREFGYRFDPSDAADLVRLAREGIPAPDLPAWIIQEGAPLRYPAALLSDTPATAFADPNDLVFLEALRRVRPDLAKRSRGRLMRELIRGIRERDVRYRLGAPYTESGDDLAAFLRPDLLKAVLLEEALRDPATVRRLTDWMMQDLADRSTERGGYVRLDPAGRLRFELHRSAAGDGNDRLLLPPEPQRAVLEFHFHATSGDDRLFAGPSSGNPGTDLFRAARHRIDGVVFTKVGGPRFDVDLYLSTKKVLDIGVFGVDSD